MLQLGLIGGMSWNSTHSYYAKINQYIHQELGSQNSASLFLSSINFEDIYPLQKANDWKAIETYLVPHIEHLTRSGCDFIALCSNTIHKIYDQLQAHTNIPIIHVADSLTDQLSKDGVQNICLLGTSFIMDDSFYQSRIQANCGCNVVLPSSADQKTIHTILIEELCQGVITAESRIRMLDIINSLTSQNVQAVVLGCTELGLILDATHQTGKFYDTTDIHCQALATRMLETS